MMCVNSLLKVCWKFVEGLLKVCWMFYLFWIMQLYPIMREQESTIIMYTQHHQQINNVTDCNNRPVVDRLEFGLSSSSVHRHQHWQSIKEVTPRRILWVGSKATLPTQTTSEQGLQHTKQDTVHRPAPNGRISSHTRTTEVVCSNMVQTISLWKVVYWQITPKQRVTFTTIGLFTMVLKSLGEVSMPNQWLIRVDLMMVVEKPEVFLSNQMRECG